MRNVTQCNATLMLRFKNAPKVAEIANLPWVIVTRKASFAPTGSIVENYSLHLVTHLVRDRVDQAGLKRTEAWESAVPAEESPQPGPAKRKL